ncbi:MAG: hypothetical protein LBN11_05090 [Tannerella sp.]|jgi:5-methylcytosine-specific restriction endonuclease McrA|nr:hypothetical protein [Tannerella sp.]
MPLDRSKYPPDWEEISRRIRFGRAANRCEECGAENYKPHPRTKGVVSLSVAHLNHDTMDNRDENLKALCQFCHLKHDRLDNKRRKKYGKDLSGLNGQLTLEL